MNLYELRHFGGWWMVNILKLPESAVTLHLGHEDGGVLVRKLYGHADQRIAINVLAAGVAASGASNPAPFHVAPAPMGTIGTPRPS